MATATSGVQVVRTLNLRNDLNQHHNRNSYKGGLKPQDLALGFRDPAASYTLVQKS